MSAGFVPLALFGFGCSLIIPLDDYIGSPSPPAHGGGGGDAQSGMAGVAALAGTAGTSNGGSAAGGEAGAEAGHEESGASGTGAEAGAGNEGGTSATGGAGGTLGGTGTGGQAGAGQGGSSGTTNGGMSGGGMSGGGMGGGGMSGGGMSGGGMSGGGMGGCAGANLDTDHDHCGSCEHACGIRQECVDGYCASSPCDGICAGLMVTVVPKGNNEFRQDKVGTSAGCFEIVGYEPMAPNAQRIIGWEFHNGRTMQVNGVPVAPITDPGCELDKIPERVGGFCVRVTADPAVDYSGFRFPYGVPAGAPSCGP